MSSDLLVAKPTPKRIERFASLKITPVPISGEAGNEAPVVGNETPLPGIDTAGEYVRRNLIAGYADGGAFGAMVGLGETYLPAFVLAVGLGEVTAGLVSSLPLIAGGLMQLVSPSMIRRLGSHKRWVLCCAALQALSFVPLVIAACIGTISAAGVMMVASLYWAAGLAAGPAWNTWMGTVVPIASRAQYFALRTRVSQAAVLLGFVLGGAALHMTAGSAAALWSYVAIFGSAAACRGISVLALAWQSEPVPIPPNMRHTGLVALAGRFVRGDGSPLLVYIVVVQAAVQLAGPYFTPFMLRQLHLNYATYVLLIATAFATKVIALPLLGRAAHRHGAGLLLWLGGVGIVPMSALWIVSDQVAWLLLVQVLSGLAWATYELAFFLLFFESIDEHERTSLLTFYNLANTAAWVGGALLGALLLSLGGTGYQAYLWLFGLSSLGRAAALVLLWRVPGIRVAAAAIGVRTIALRPNSASLDAPILPSLPDRLPHDGVERR